MNLDSLKRAENIDVFRALGIIFMVMGHIDFGGYFSYFIHAFHMPMFFFISGMFFKKNKTITFRDYFRRQSKKLLVPYYFWAILHLLIWYLWHKPSDEMLMDSIRAVFLFNSSNMPIAGALWFLTALFWANLLYYLLYRYIKIEWLRATIIISFSIMGCSIRTLTSIEMPLSLGPGMVGVGIMYIGDLLHSNNLVEYFSKIKSVIIIPLGIFTSILIAINGYINMREECYAFIPMFWINAILSILIGINISTFMKEIFPNKLISYLKFCGRNSIVFLCTNQLFIIIISCFTKSIMPNSEYLTKVIQLIFSMATISILAKLYESLKNRFYKRGVKGV